MQETGIGNVEVTCMHTGSREVMESLREDGVVVKQGHVGLQSCLHDQLPSQDRLQHCLDLSQSWRCQSPRCGCTGNSSGSHCKPCMAQVMSCSHA